jgi:hypothetical protein
MEDHMNWKLSKIVRNNTYMVDGVNIFDLEWKKDGQVELKDVAHAMRRPFDVCSVDVNGKEFKFAVCEIGRNVFCFYVAA